MNTIHDRGGLPLLDATKQGQVLPPEGRRSKARRRRREGAAAAGHALQLVPLADGHDRHHGDGGGEGLEREVSLGVGAGRQQGSSRDGAQPLQRDGARRTGDYDFRGKPSRISLPTYWKDVEHFSDDPARTVIGSLSTTLSKSIDIAQNKDFQGNYVYNPTPHSPSGRNRS
jgi:hypothetical protein